MIRLLLALFFLAGPSAILAQSTAQWQRIPFKGESYVTLTNTKDFYGFTAMKRTGDKITLDKIHLHGNKTQLLFINGQQDMWINGVKFLLSFPIRQVGNQYLLHTIDLAKLIDPVMRPHNISRGDHFDTVIIDPGHGGHDPGTVSRHGNGDEKVHTLSLANILAKQLRNRGFKVIMTRNKDTFLSLQQRVDFANQYTNSIFISLHFNAGGGGRAQGIETFSLAPKGVAHYGQGLKESDFLEKVGNNNDAANIALATTVHTTITKNTGRRDRGVRRARYSVLTGVRHPAVLIEGGFLGSREEGALIASQDYQERLAFSIAEAVVKYKMATEPELRTPQPDSPQ